MERGSKEIPCFSTVVVESCLNHYRAIFEFVSPTVVLAILCLVCSYFDPIQGLIIIQTVHVCQTHKIWDQSVAGRRLWQCLCGKLLCLPWERGKWRSYKLLVSWITFWLRTLPHVEQFGSTERVCHHVWRRNWNREMVQAQRGHLLFTKWHDKRDVAFLSTKYFTNCTNTTCAMRKERLRNYNSETACCRHLHSEHARRWPCWSTLYLLFYWLAVLKWYRYIFWFLFNLSVCISFVLSSVHRGRKGTLLKFHFELAKQLINGFSQQKRKRHSLEGLSGSVVGLEEHVSVKVEGRKRKCVHCIRAGRRTPKGYKIETCFECKLCKVALCRTCHNDFHSQAE